MTVNVIPFVRPAPKPPLASANDPDIKMLFTLCGRLTDDEVLDLYNDFIGHRINNILLAAGRKKRLPGRIDCPTWRP
jgi:hypothetical protein